MKTIRGKITVFYIVCLGFIGIITILYYTNIHTLETKLQIVQRFDDLLEDILEIRRYEKNVTYYRDTESLNEIVFYIFKVEDTCRAFAREIHRVAGIEKCRALRSDLQEYKRTLQENMAVIKAGSGGVVAVEALRERGKPLVDFAQELIAKKRHRIQRTLARMRIIPLAFLGSFFVLVVVTFYLLTKDILQPISRLRSATLSASRGVFLPIPYAEKRKGEVSDLIAMFNKMVKEIETRQEQIIQSRKMASIGTFTSGIAHELNNPINNISLIVESLLDEEEMPAAERTRLYRDLMEQADRTSEIVRNLLEFSRTDHPEMEKIAVEEVVQRTARLIRNELRLRRIRYSAEIRGPLPPLRLDRNGFQQVLLNLFLNGIQAMEGGGELRVTLGTTERGEVRVDIEDTGKGIPAEHLDRIFDPFFTTKKEGEGTGLGLSVTYSIVKKHGGRIEVRSRPGEGTRFSIFFPAGGGDEEG